MNLATFDLNLLRAADALLVECSVTRAANRIGVTQQAMSGQLRRLRDVFSDPLLIQRGRSLTPTPLGAALAQPIREVLVYAERALATTPKFDATVSRRKFAVAALSYVGSTILPRLMAEFTKSAPNVSVRLSRVDGRIFQDLAEGRADVAILNAHWREDQGLLPDDIRSVPLFDDTFVCVSDSRHVVNAAALSVQDYSSARHIVVDLGPGSLTSVQKAWIRHRMAPNVAYVQESFTDLLFMLPETNLVATVQKRLADRWAARLGLSICPAPFEIDPVNVEMLWHTRDEDDPANQFLRESIHAMAEQIH